MNFPLQIANHKLREINIQPNSRIVHIHIPKTAGTTFNAILESLVWGFDRCTNWNFLNLADEELEKIRQYQFFIGHFTFSLFSEIIFPKGFIGLTFLREPVSRTISYLRFIHQQFQQGELHEYYPKIKGNDARETSLRELAKALLLDDGHNDTDLFLEFLIKNNYKIGWNLVDFQTKAMGTSYYPLPKMQTNPKDFLINFFVQHHAKQDSKDALFKRLNLNIKSGKQAAKKMTPANHDLAKKRLEQMAFFGLTERFQDSLFLLSYTFGWRPILNKLHLNAGLKSNSTKKPSPEVSTLIEKYLTFDIPFYKFGEQIFEQRFNDMTEALLKQYGKKEHATLKRPLPADLMMELLEQHYVKRRDQRLKRAFSPNTKILHHSPSMYTEGPFGWYPLENSDIHGAYRWSGPGLQSGFDLPCPNGKNIRVSFCLLAAMGFDIIEGLSLTVNGTPIEIQFTTDPQGHFLFSGEISPQAISGPFLRLIFSVPGTVSPNSLDEHNKDNRSLGIALNWVELQALTA